MVVGVSVGVSLGVFVGVSVGVDVFVGVFVEVGVGVDAMSFKLSCTMSAGVNGTPPEVNPIDTGKEVVRFCNNEPLMYMKNSTVPVPVKYTDGLVLVAP